MIRPVHVWLAALLCLAVIGSAMGYLSALAIQLDRSETEARAIAEREGRIRTALWRMDYALAPLVTQENLRPYTDYAAFSPAAQVYNRGLIQATPGTDSGLVPSPLLSADSPLIELYFQIDPEGAVTSPQVPPSTQRDLVLDGDCSSAQLARSQTRLADLRPVLQPQLLLEGLPSATTTAPLQIAQFTRRSQTETSPISAQASTDLQVETESPTQQGKYPQAQQVKVAVQQQELANKNELQARQDSYQMNAGANLFQTQQAALVPSSGKSRSDAGALYVHEGPVQPLWLGDKLILARRVELNRRTLVQGCWLNWPAVESLLLNRVRDLLPEARVRPVRDGAPRSPTNLLAGFPIELVPGAVAIAPLPGLSPVYFTLLISWICAAVAALAVIGLLLGTLRLSERRAAFVSAVTHELRTPLTTLRLYTDMLERGMVKSDDQRTHYLRTLRIEADRLGQLVANVLSFARLERGRNGTHPVSIAVGELLAGMQDRLAQRTEQAAMRWTISLPDDLRPATVHCDPAAVEQILFNLVDNACKYAAQAADPNIELMVHADPRQVMLAVRDHGPGVSAEVAGKLFTPFSKSAAEAANSAPGVGLGLALSKRLARQMKATLMLSENSPDGACFTLRLPRIG